MKQDLSLSSLSYISPENVEHIRERLQGVMAHYRMGLGKIADALGISANELHSFLFDRHDVSFIILIRIEDFVIDMEQDMKMHFK